MSLTCSEITNAGTNDDAIVTIYRTTEYRNKKWDLSS